MRAHNYPLGYAREQALGALAAPLLPTPTPPDPAVSRWWHSSAYKHLIADPSPSSRYELCDGQEPSAWYANGRYNLLYSGGTGVVGYRYCTGDPTVVANWSTETKVIDRAPLTAEHGSLFIDGAALYYHFVDRASKQIMVATADISSPTVWTVGNTGLLNTLPGDGTSTGNMFVVKDAATYYMFVESLSTDALGGAGTVSSWQTQLYTGSSPTGTFTQLLGGARLASLRPNNGEGSVSGSWVTRENGEWVMYYHGGSWASFLPNDAYRAVTTNLGADSWTQLDQGAPWVKRAHAREIDQAVDLAAVRGPNGQAFLFYAGNDNTLGASTFRVMVTKLLPCLMEYHDGSWHRAQEGNDHRLPIENPYTPRVQQSVPWLDNNGQSRTGTWILEGNTPTGMFGGCRRMTTGPASGDSIEYDVILTPGTYQFRMYACKGPDHGNIDVHVAFGDTSSYFLPLISGFDLYDPTLTPNSSGSATFTIRGTEPRRGRIRFRTTSKNASSSNFRMSLQGWTLVRTDY